MPSLGCNVSSIIGEKGKEESQKEDKDFALDIVLQQFKHTETGKENACSVGNSEPGSATADERDKPRKRKRGLFLAIVYVSISWTFEFECF